MKKALAVLAVLAAAATAQAELLATWTATTPGQNLNGATIAQTGGGTYTFSMVGAAGFSGSSAPAAYTFAAAGATTASAALAFANNEYLYFTWDTDYTLTLESAIAFYTRGASGAQNAQWGTIIGGVWTDIGDEISGIVTATPTTSTTPTTTSFTGVSGLTSGQLGLAIFGGTGTTATDWFRLDSRPSATPQVALSLNGTMEPTAIPEPATMGLLGIGALAMVLRRKIRK